MTGSGGVTSQGISTTPSAMSAKPKLEVKPEATKQASPASQANAVPAAKKGNGIHKPVSTQGSPTLEDMISHATEIAFRAKKVAQHAGDHVADLKRTWYIQNPGKTPPWANAKKPKGNHPPTPATKPEQPAGQKAA